ncbi:MAG: PilZ domain-containing protein [Spirochaetaceae bacterium]|jgi:c-di-GMP-binding flagellar brake protein YcgR|nr:PilZ domain-containing protein [Spirochaetaceae bacterium]
MLFLIIFVILGGAFLVVYNSRGGGGSGAKGGIQGEWIQFVVKGKDSGFSFKEIELLKKLAIKSELEDPTSLFWSQEQLDRCIKSLIKNARASGEDQEPGTQEFLSRLYDYRKKIEVDRPKSLQGISSTRELVEEQRVRVLISGTGVFGSYIIKNTRDYLTIARPAGENLPQSYKWRGAHISIYFWRNEDAGYVFDTDVIDEVYSKGMAALQLKHSESVFRTQKRKSTRLKTHLPAFLYLLGDGASTDTVETRPGLKCFMEDLSDGGCALSIGGKTAPGLRIKVQFELDGDALVMSGTVRSVDYREMENRSLLHVEAETLPLATKNHILGQVLGMIDEEDELPLRLVDEQAPSPAAPDMAEMEAGSGDLPPGLTLEGLAGSGPDGDGFAGGGLEADGDADGPLPEPFFGERGA